MTEVNIKLTDDGETTHVEHDIEEKYDPENPKGSLYYGNAILLFLMEFGGFQPEDVESIDDESDGLPGDSEHGEKPLRLLEELT